jgi:hypothetical protein
MGAGNRDRADKRRHILHRACFSFVKLNLSNHPHRAVSVSLECS